MRSCQSVLCEAFCLQKGKNPGSSLVETSEPEGRIWPFFFILISSPSHRSSHGRRRSREMVDGLCVSWAEPGEVPDPEIRMVVIKVVGNAGVCHSTVAA